MAALAAGQWTANAGGTGTSVQPHRDDFTVAAVVTALMTLAVTAFALLIVLRLIQCLMNRRRLAAWEAAWRTTGPRWTGHRS
jgi:DMSO/TMAO reductase YedYZ heme-binding membrane subunit